MPPSLFRETVIERQRRHIQAEIGGPLPIRVAAKDGGTGAGVSDIAGGEKQKATGADIGCSGGELVCPIAQISVAGFCLAKVSAMCLTCASGRPVTRSTSCGGHFAACLRISSTP